MWVVYGPPDNMDNVLKNPALRPGFLIQNLSCERRRFVAIPQSPLHQHRIQPSPVFVADGVQNAYMVESKAFVQAEGSGVGAVADDADHLTQSQGFALFDQGGEEDF